MKRWLLAVLVILMGCTSPEIPTEAATPTPELIVVPGIVETYYVEDTATAKFGRDTLILAIDGVGPAGVSIRGVKGILIAGDPIIREVLGRGNLELGVIEEVMPNTQQVRIRWYYQAKSVP